MRTTYVKFGGAVLALLIAGVAPLLIGDTYYLHLLILAGINAMLALTFVILLRTGLMSLAIAAFWGIGAYASAVLTVKFGLSVWLAFPLSALLAGIVGLIIGFFLLKNAGFTFVMLTSILGMLMVEIFGSTHTIGGFMGLTGVPAPGPIVIGSLVHWEFDTKTHYYYLMLFFIVLLVVIYSALYRSWAGRAWLAIGLNPELAKSIGVSVFWYRMLAWGVACATSGLAGSLYVHYIGALEPTQFSMFKSMYVQAYAVVGGLGFAIAGPLIGSLIMTFAPEFLRVTKELEPIFTGAIFILVMLFLPHGLLHLLGLPGGSFGRQPSLTVAEVAGVTKRATRAASEEQTRSGRQ